MAKLAKVIFFTLLTSIFFFEGFGIRSGREITYFIVLFMPLTLFAIDFLQKKPIVVPKKIGLLLLIYLGLLSVSTYFSVQVQKAFEQTLFYAAVFLIFIYVNNHKDELKKPVFIYIVVVGLILSFWALFLRYLPGELTFFYPQRDYQYVTPIGGTHIALSSYLVIPIIMFLSLYVEKRKSTHLILGLLFFPFFLFSFSKASYIVMIFFWFYLFFSSLKKRNLFYPLFLVLLISITSIFFLFTTKINLPIKTLKATKTVLQKRFWLVERRVLSSRNKLIADALRSIKERPLFGVGPGNYIFISKKYLATLGQRNDTSHNIILDVFSEHGIPAGTIFVLIIYFFIKNSRNNKDDLTKAYFITLMFLLALFQGDYVHRFYSFFVLFLVIIGLTYKEKESYRVNKILLFSGTGIIALGAILMIISHWFFSQKENKLANILYPLNKNIYPRLINECRKKGDIDCQKKYLELYGQLCKAERGAHLYIGNWHKNQQDYQKALLEFKLAYEWAPFEPGSIVNIYELNKLIGKPELAIELANKHFLKLQNLNAPMKYHQYYYVFKEARKLCDKIYDSICPYGL